MHSKIYNLEEVNSRYINDANDENAIEERMFNNGQADYVTEDRGADKEDAKTWLKEYWNRNGLPVEETEKDVLVIKKEDIKKYLKRYAKNTQKKINKIFAKEEAISAIMSKMSLMINNFGGYWFISEDYTEMPEVEWLEMQMNNANNANEEEIKLKLVHTYDYHY